MSGSSMTKSQLELVIMDEEPKKQGIVSILCSDSERSACKSATSLRRTLSADMSSRKWLSQHGFSPMKKIASSKELSHCQYSISSSDEEEGDLKETFKKEVNAGQFDIWSSILSQKDKDKSCSVPYIHPLVKRSGSCLSEKSLEVCTESLGSETGADVFSSYPSYPSSESGDLEEEQQQQQQLGLDYEDVRVVKYNYTPSGKKLPPLSFPPPLPSRRMMPRRENGRLVLEAVSVSAQNSFKAERQDGRLVLTFLKEAETNQQDEKVIDDLEEYFGSPRDSEEDDGEEEEDNKIGREIEIMMEQSSKMSSGVIKIHRLALTRDHKFNEDVTTTVAQTLPPLHPAGARLTAASFNAYDYWWRAKPTAAQAMEKKGGNKYIISKNNSSIIANNHYNWEELEVGKGKKSDYYYIVGKGCKEQRRSLFWEPYCIATS